MKLLDNRKVINEEVYRKVMVYQEKIPDHFFGDRDSMEQFLETARGEFIRERAQHIEILEQHEPALAVTNRGIVCYLKEKDITYLSLTQS